MKKENNIWIITIAVMIISIFHLLFGLVSICVGVIGSIRAEIWLAHTVSPIWSGSFWCFTGLLGFACCRKKTAYVVMCFTAFSIVSMVVAIISIQLLRLGLVNQTTDGNVYEKASKDISIIIALGLAGSESLICLISFFVSCQLSKMARKIINRRREGTFHVQVLGDKDILVVNSEGFKQRKINETTKTTTTKPMVDDLATLNLIKGPFKFRRSKRNVSAKKESPNKTPSEINCVCSNEITTII